MVRPIGVPEQDNNESEVRNMKKLLIIALVVAGLFGATAVDYKDSADLGTNVRKG